METNLNQKVYRSLMTSLFSVSFAAALPCLVTDLCIAQTAKRITPDPYFSTLYQSSAPQAPSTSEPKSIYQSPWEPPKTATETTPARQAKINKAQDEAEVWSSLARKTTKPVTRIDFSRLNVQPPKKADVSLPKIARQPLTPAVVAELATKPAPPLKFQALTPIDVPNKVKSPPIQTLKSAEEIIKNAVAKSRSIIRQKNAEVKNAEIKDPANFVAGNSQRVKTPAANLSPPTKAKPLNPGNTSSGFNMPKLAAGTKIRSALPTVSQASAIDENDDSSVGVGSKIATVDGDGSFVQQAAYQPQVGERLKKMVEKRVGAPPRAAAGSGARVAVPERAAPRIADAASNYYAPNSVPMAQVENYAVPAETEIVTEDPSYAPPTAQQPYFPEQSYQQPSEEQYSSEQPYQQPYFQGESFENSRVLALVGGHPVFVGDMMFEVNQILEKHMKGAPQVAKDAQKGKLMERLLPKYVDQKILFVSTLDQLPDEANIEDILKQAEETFNEKALPELMENSGVESVTKFDGILRSQGTSVRQMRRAWAKDQISKYFLQEKVKFNRQVTHLEMLDEYRSNYDQYAVKGKVRWEQIEIQPAKAGGRFAAKDKIESIYDRLVHGGNFEAIAKKESHGFRAFKGGQYDWTSRGSLVNKEIDKSIFSLPQGKLSGVIETKAGFHVIRVIERVEDHHTPFTEAQVEIKKQLLEARRDEAFRTYIDGLKDKISVEYVNE